VKKSPISQLRYLCLITADGAAEYQLSYRYQHGEGVRANTKKALKYLDQAVELGWPPALNAKGEQEEVAGRFAQAISLYQKAAEAQYPRAMWHLGCMHLHGHGMPRSAVKAFIQFEQAAQSGDGLAQYSYAQMLEQGIGYIKDPQQALYWYDKAAAQGLKEAANAAERLRAAQNN